MKWFAQAPANIALIKYMGKTNQQQNLPSNPSLSYTLNNLESFVELESTNVAHDSWEPLDLPGHTELFQLSKHAQQRFLKHLAFLKQQFKCDAHFIVRSCNNFPLGVGLASSASSFAALTKCTDRARAELQASNEYDNDQLAQLSRQGSGSSCRSFYSPWCLWQEHECKTIELPYPELLHQVVVITHDEKAVPSSEAHQRVSTSPLFADRPQRATKRLQELLSAFENQQWQRAKDIAWDEFQDMHQLFATAAEPFSYMTDATKQVLADLEKVWDEHGDGPIVTMDAGPNVHLLYRPDQAQLAQNVKLDYFLSNYDVL